jgi:hypothetical protein
MPYNFLENLLNVLVQIANKMGIQKNIITLMINPFRKSTHYGVSIFLTLKGCRPFYYYTPLRMRKSCSN